MAILNKEELKQLSRQRDKTCISIYIPTHRMGKEIEQDPIRLRNMLRQVSANLEKKDFRAREIEELLSPANKLLDSHDFWNHQSDGLAVFLSENESYIYRLPLSFNEMNSISRRFYIKQLLPLFADDGRFLILALDLHNLRLYEASKYDLVELELKDVPTNIDDILKYDDPEEQIQYHTGMRDVSGKRRSIYHGHGGLDESVRKKNVSRYIEAAEKAISKFIADRREPLVLAGLETSLSMYKETNAYPHLLEEAVSMNPDELDTERLHQKAWQIAEPYFEREKKRGLEKYNDELGTGLASNDVEDIIRASYAKRIEYLFLRKGDQVFGTYDRAGNKVYMGEKDEEGSEDLLDFAAVQTILSDGAVYILEGDEMPGGNKAAAVYRY